MSPRASARKSAAKKPKASAGKAAKKRAVVTRSKAKTKPAHPSTIGENPLDVPASRAAVIAAILGRQAGERAERHERTKAKSVRRR